MYQFIHTPYHIVSRRIYLYCKLNNILYNINEGERNRLIKKVISFLYNYLVYNNYKIITQHIYIDILPHNNHFKYTKFNYFLNLKRCHKQMEFI